MTDAECVQLLQWCLRAPGDRRRDVPAAALVPIIELEPFAPKALYLSVFGVGTSTLREPALRLIEETELNAVVIGATHGPHRLSRRARAGCARADRP